MARTKGKNLTAAIRAPFAKKMNNATVPVNTQNNNNFGWDWAFDSGFEARADNAAGTDVVRLHGVDANDDRVYVAEEATKAYRKTIHWQIQDNASISTQAFFIADRPYRVVSVTEVHATASSVAGTAYVEKTPSGTAPGSGTSVMASTFDLTSTAQTPVTAAIPTTNTADSDNPDLQLATGDALSVVVAGTITSLVGMHITVVLAPGGSARTVNFVMNSNADLVQAQRFFTANRPYQVSRVDMRWSTKSSVAGLKLTVTKDTGTTAPGGGTSLLTDNTNAGPLVTQTANTTYNGTLTATVATLRLATGDGLALKFSGASLTALAGLVITVTLVERASDRKEVTFTQHHVVGASDLVGLTATTFFTADRDYEILDIREYHDVIGSDGGAVTIGVTVDTGTTAPGGGQVQTTSDFSIKATARTTQVGTLQVLGLRFLQSGDRLSIKPTGTFTAAQGVNITVALAPH